MTPACLPVFAPGLLYLLISAHGMRGALGHISLCAAVQVAVGFPFLAFHPASYIKASFNLGRVFMHRWSVNLKFVPEVRVRPYAAIGKLVEHEEWTPNGLSSRVCTCS